MTPITPKKQDPIEIILSSENIDLAGQSMLRADDRVYRVKQLHDGLLQVFTKAYSGANIKKITAEIANDDEVRNRLQALVIAVNSLASSIREEGHNGQDIDRHANAATPEITGREHFSYYYTPSESSHPKTIANAEAVNAHAQTLATILVEKLPSIDPAKTMLEHAIEQNSQQINNPAAAIRLAAAFMQPAATIGRIMNSDYPDRHQTEVTRTINNTASAASVKWVPSVSDHSPDNGPEGSRKKRSDISAV